MTKVKIKVPSCWEKLVQIDFEDLEEYPFSAEHIPKKDSDPTPFVDDYRSISTTLEDGKIIGVELASGQSNYYGGCYILSSDGSPLYSETWDYFYGTNCISADDGEYEIEIEWI